MATSPTGAKSRTTEPEPAGPPTDATLVRQRWISRPRREWAEECARIMRRYGVVEGSRVYEERQNARWHARSLIRLMVELRLAERHELVEHTERRVDGWGWTIEWAGPDGKQRRKGRVDV